MAYTELVSVSAGSTDGNGVTTAGVDTTGADLIVVALGGSSGASSGTLSDSNSNTWTALTASAGNALSQLYYCQAPTVGAGHTFTFSTTADFPSIAVIAFSGSTSTPFDTENGANSGASTVGTIQPGSITPSVDNCLVVYGSANGTGGGASSVDVGTLQETVSRVASQHLGVSIAYDIQTTATAINPTFTLSTNAIAAATIASFKPVAGGTNYTRTITDGLELYDGTAGAEPIREINLTDSDELLLHDAAAREAWITALDEILLHDFVFISLDRLLVDFMLLYDSATAEQFTPGATNYSRTVTDTLFLLDQTVREQAHVVRDSLFLSDGALRELLLTVLDKVFVDDGTQRVLEVTKQDGLLLAQLQFRLLEKFVTDGLYLTDSTTASHIVAGAVFLTWARLQASNPLGVEASAVDALGRRIGAVDYLGRAVSAIKWRKQ